MSKAGEIKQLRANRDTSIDRISIVYEIARQTITDPLQNFHFRIRYQELDEVYEQFNIQHDILIQALAVQENVDEETGKLSLQAVDKKYFQIRAIDYDTFEALALPTNTSSASVANEKVKLHIINVSTFSRDLKD
ncbi:hypothetical protein JTB14_026237 [Gonioctena quinquepunctata]|nr:hypothetical protein JTB14_026237 [Gonioctena quinquepunctata]